MTIEQFVMAYGAEQDEQHQQPGNGKSPAPALAQDAARLLMQN